MLSFKEYLTEVFDKPHPFTQTKKTEWGGDMSTHRYMFMTDDKKKFHVHITHNKTTGESEIGFHDNEGSTGMTGMSGHKSARIISTVAAVARHHAKTTPTAKRITFEGEKHVDKSERTSLTGRNKVYARLAAKVGGSTKEGEYHTHHSVPADALRAA